MLGAASATPLVGAEENLRKFIRGRRRLKALLLAVMLGLHNPSATSRDKRRALTDALASDEEKVAQSQFSTLDDPLGSRRAALKFFVPKGEKKGSYKIGGEDIRRVMSSIGEDLSDAEVRS